MLVLFITMILDDMLFIYSRLAFNLWNRCGILLQCLDKMKKSVKWFFSLPFKTTLFSETLLFNKCKINCNLHTDI